MRLCPTTTHRSCATGANLTEIPAEFRGAGRVHTVDQEFPPARGPSPTGRVFCPYNGKPPRSV